MRVFQTISLFALVAVAGCAVYPTTRTYFEPNASDGKPSPSMSCGYHRAKNDSLVRDTKDLHIQVTPYYKEGENLKVTILFQSDKDNVEINPRAIGIKAHQSGKVIYPSSIKITNQLPRNNWPYYSKWVYLTFPISSDSLISIAVTFKRSSILVNGRVINIQQFRFKKATKSDIYYGSINC